MLKDTIISEVIGKVEWRRLLFPCKRKEYVCSKCGKTIFTTLEEPIAFYRTELIDTVDAHLVSCPNVQEKIEVPNIRMIRV